MSIRLDIAQGLKEARIRQGLTQKGLADRMRVHQPKVATVERYGPSSFKLLEMFCEGLGLSFDWGFGTARLMEKKPKNKRGPYGQLTASGGPLVKTVPAKPKFDDELEALRSRKIAVVNDPKLAKKLAEAPPEGVEIKDGDITYVNLEEARDLGEVLRGKSPEERVEPTDG